VCVGTDVARVFVHLCLLFRRANSALERVSYTGTVVYMVCECNPIPTTAAGVHVGTREPEKTKTALIWRHSPQPEARKSTNFGMSAFRFGALANDALTPRCGLLLGGRGLAAVGHDDCGRGPPMPHEPSDSNSRDWCNAPSSPLNSAVRRFSRCRPLRLWIILHDERVLRVAITRVQAFPYL